MADMQHTERAAHLARYRFAPGESGNRRGKAAGTRDRLGRKFLQALAQDFEEYGSSAIALARVEDPLGYCRLVASLLPQHLVNEHHQGPTLIQVLACLDGKAKIEDFLPDDDDAPDGAAGTALIEGERREVAE
jgi:hypothetical protein